MAFITGPVPERIERDMTASAEAFERDLRQAWSGELTRVGAGRFRLSEGAIVLRVGIVESGSRRLGILTLPRLRVVYRFSGGDEAARRRLLGVLDRSMQRGGG